MSLPKYLVLCARCEWCSAWTPAVDLLAIYPDDAKPADSVFVCPRCTQDWEAECAEEKHVELEAEWYAP